MSWQLGFQSWLLCLLFAWLQVCYFSTLPQLLIHEWKIIIVPISQVWHSIK